jgi:hypothetical protein
MYLSDKGEVMNDLKTIKNQVAVAAQTETNKHQAVEAAREASRLDHNAGIELGDSLRALLKCKLAVFIDHWVSAPILLATGAPPKPQVASWYGAVINVGVDHTSGFRPYLDIKKPSTDVTAAQLLRVFVDSITAAAIYKDDTFERMLEAALGRSEESRDEMAFFGIEYL